MDQHVTNLGEDISYQRREWVVQRVGWVVMALIVVAALFGLLGESGPFAEAELRAADGSLQVHHVRIAHHHAPAALTITVAPDLVEGGELRLWIDAAYARTLDIQSIIPEPESVEVGPERIVYTFAVADWKGSLTIVYHYEQESYWWKRGHLGIEGGAAVELVQFVFP